MADGRRLFLDSRLSAGIALLAAGALAVPATAVLIVVTLVGAVPIYAAVAKRSYAGQGSIALLENLFSGWTGKILVLVLLGFAATDFVITMTLPLPTPRVTPSPIRICIRLRAARTSA